MFQTFSHIELCYLWCFKVSKLLGRKLGKRTKFEIRSFTFQIELNSSLRWRHYFIRLMHCRFPLRSLNYFHFNLFAWFNDYWFCNLRWHLFVFVSRYLISCVIFSSRKVRMFVCNCENFLNPNSFITKDREMLLKRWNFCAHLHIVIFMQSVTINDACWPFPDWLHYTIILCRSSGLSQTSSFLSSSLCSISVSVLSS